MSTSVRSIRDSEASIKIREAFFQKYNIDQNRIKVSQKIDVMTEEDMSFDWSITLNGICVKLLYADDSQFRQSVSLELLKKYQATIFDNPIFSPKKALGHFIKAVNAEPDRHTPIKLDNDDKWRRRALYHLFKLALLLEQEPDTLFKELNDFTETLC